MKNLLLLLCLILAIGCNDAPENSKKTVEPTKDISEAEDSLNFGIVIHGGAGSIREKNMSDSLQAAYEAKLEEAIRTGYEILASGGSSVDAVR
ncbi:MAG TPA: isoaspartyl peptidase/L-asparaginase, partial [Salinimicrobium sp.]|nr:isoaspartyl peptidase/L-asparaginase [Salinimicrobium sp.]